MKTGKGMMDIALCTDNNYAMPAGVMMHSVCKHTVNVTFHVIVPEDFSVENRARLTKIAGNFDAHISFITVSKDFVKNCPVGRIDQPEHVSIAAYYRLFLGTLLPDSVRRVIYLDCDLICQSSLRELWEIDLGGAALAAVDDIPRPWQHPQERLGYDSSFRYFNSGVLLIDLEYWRSHNVTDSFAAFINSSPGKLEFHDQDVLNYVFHESVLIIPPKFNATDIFFHKEFLTYGYQYSPDEVNEARTNPVIVHFTYRHKPWFKGGSHTYRNTFLRYKSETPWRRQRLKTKKAKSLRGLIANLLVNLGLYNYHDDYIQR